MASYEHYNLAYLKRTAIERQVVGPEHMHSKLHGRPFYIDKLKVADKLLASTSSFPDARQKFRMNFMVDPNFMMDDAQALVTKTNHVSTVPLTTYNEDVDFAKECRAMGEIHRQKLSIAVSDEERNMAAQEKSDLLDQLVNQRVRAFEKALSRKAYMLADGAYARLPSAMKSESVPVKAIYAPSIVPEPLVKRTTMASMPTIAPCPSSAIDNINGVQITNPEDGDYEGDEKALSSHRRKRRRHVTPDSHLAHSSSPEIPLVQQLASSQREPASVSIVFQRPPSKLPPQSHELPNIPPEYPHILIRRDHFTANTKDMDLVIMLQKKLGNALHDIFSDRRGHILVFDGTDMAQQVAQKFFENNHLRNFNLQYSPAMMPPQDVA